MLANAGKSIQMPPPPPPSSLYGTMPPPMNYTGRNHIAPPPPADPRSAVRPPDSPVATPTPLFIPRQDHGYFPSLTSAQAGAPFSRGPPPPPPPPMPSLPVSAPLATPIVPASDTKPSTESQVQQLLQLLVSALFQKILPCNVVNTHR